LWRGVIGKRTTQEKSIIDNSLVLQLDLPVQIISRNPEIKALKKRYGKKGMLDNQSKYQKEFQKIVAEVSGNKFPRMPFPAFSEPTLRK